jgi:hypothetical protein
MVSAQAPNQVDACADEATLVGTLGGIVAGVGVLTLNPDRQLSWRRALIALPNNLIRLNCGGAGQ